MRNLPATNSTPFTYCTSSHVLRSFQVRGVSSCQHFAARSASCEIDPRRQQRGGRRGDFNHISSFCFAAYQFAVVEYLGSLIFLFSYFFGYPRCRRGRQRSTRTLIARLRRSMVLSTSQSDAFLPLAPHPGTSILCTVPAHIRPHPGETSPRSVENAHDSYMPSLCRLPAVRV